MLGAFAMKAHDRKHDADEPGHDREQALPTDPAAQINQEPAAREHPELVAHDLHGVASAELAWIEHVDRQTVDRDVLRCREEVHEKYERQKREEPGFRRHESSERAGDHEERL